MVVADVRLSVCHKTFNLHHGCSLFYTYYYTTTKFLQRTREIIYEVEEVYLAEVMVISSYIVNG